LTGVFCMEMVSLRQCAPITEKSSGLKIMLKDAYVKLIVTRGVRPIGVDIPRLQKPTTVIYANQLKKIPDRVYSAGVRIDFSNIQKNNKSFTAGVKSLNYIDNIMARSYVHGNGFYDALFTNVNNHISETAISNIFVVKGGKVFTPPLTAGLLSGITRETIIELVRTYFKSRVNESNISRKMLINADEVMLTNSMLEMVPVISVGKKRIGKGRPGQFYRILHTLYKMKTR